MNGVGRGTAVNNCGVFIICPYPLVGGGLQRLLDEDEDIHIAGAVADIKTALAVLPHLRPDVVLMVLWEREDVATAVQALKADWPGLPLVILSPNTSPEQIQATLMAGVTGYLPLTVQLDDLIQAILTTSRDELALHPSIVPPLLAYLAGQSQADHPPDLNTLSPRQQEVLAYLACGLSDRDIAQALFISVRTVQTHLAHIYAKLGVHSRTEAAVLAVRAGWFSKKQPDQ